MSNNSKSIAKNTVYYSIYQLFNIAFPFITAMYVARILLPDAVGKVSYAQNIAQYFVILAFLGIPTYGMREIAKVSDDREKRSKVYSELFLINFVSTVVFSTIYFLLIIIRFRDEFLLYFVTGILIVLNVINISWLFEGMEEFRYISIRNIVFKIINFLMLIMFVKNKNDYMAYALITVIGTAGNGVINILYANKFVYFSKKDLDIKRHLKPIFRLVVVNLAIELYSLVDVTMLGYLSDNENVAFYSYASKINKMILQILNTFTIVVVPRLTIYYNENNKVEFNKILTKSVEIILVLAIPFIFGVQIVAEDVVCILYGDAFFASAIILRILSAMLVISPLGYLLGSRVLLVSNNEEKMIISVSIGAVVNIILNAFLIPLYLGQGAAMASVISELCVAIVYCSLGRKYYKLGSIKENLFKIIISSVIMCLVLLIIERLISTIIIKLILQIAVAVILYFGILLFLKEDLVLNVFYRIKNRLRHN